MQEPALNPDALEDSPRRNLRRGDEVELLQGDETVAHGEVDAVTADRRIVWIRLDGGQGRRLFHAQDGFRFHLVSRKPLPTVDADAGLIETRGRNRGRESNL
jgi:hypothetical protein